MYVRWPKVNGFDTFKNENFRRRTITTQPNQKRINFGNFYFYFFSAASQTESGVLVGMLNQVFDLISLTKFAKRIFLTACKQKLLMKLAGKRNAIQRISRTLQRQTDRQTETVKEEWLHKQCL